MEKNLQKKALLLLALLFSFQACKDLDTLNENRPDREGVIATGSDLLTVLQGAYLTWWQGVHDDHPGLALGIAGDAYTMPWGSFGAFRFGQEPRQAFLNRQSEDPDYQQVVGDPWFGCLSAVSSANDVLRALEEGISIDNGGPQDESVRAAALFLRGVSWGYLGLIFDQSFLIREDADISQTPSLSPYPQLILASVEELKTAAGLATGAGSEFVHRYFNGLTLDSDKFARLCHSYAARLLAQSPRTAADNAKVNWQEVLNHTEKGISVNFAPLADGNAWKSYQKYVFAETGQGPLWARVDQRLVAALDPSQPARYPELSKGEPALSNPRARSADKRLETDFTFFQQQNFPVDRGEYFFSHYKHNRNKVDPSFAGDGASFGPMPAFLAADNTLLRAEALLRLNRLPQAIELINAGTRVSRGQLAPIRSAATAAEVEKAIFYERAIELLSTAPMNQWLDRRRVGPRVGLSELDALGGLLSGTPAQLPVPAAELRLLELPVYQFGGPQDPEGIKAVF